MSVLIRDFQKVRAINITALTVSRQFAEWNYIQFIKPWIGQSFFHLIHYATLKPVAKREAMGTLRGLLLYAGQGAPLQGKANVTQPIEATIVLVPEGLRMLEYIHIQIDHGTSR